MAIPSANAFWSWSSRIKHEFKGTFQENNRANDSKKPLLTHFMAMKGHIIMPNKADTTQSRTQSINWCFLSSISTVILKAMSFSVKVTSTLEIYH